MTPPGPAGRTLLRASIVVSFLATSAGPASPDPASSAAAARSTEAATTTRTPAATRSAPAAQTPAVPQSAPAQDSTPRDLRNLLARGYILQDRNGDDVPDFVAVRLLLPARPGPAEVAAAADLAARLGYETSATDLDLIDFERGRPGAYDVPIIRIGAGVAGAGGPGGADAAGAARGRTRPGEPAASAVSAASAAAAGRLAPGQGAITWLPPGTVLRRGGVLVEGADATGLLAAAAYLASRYPNVWSTKGTTFEDLAAKFGPFLEEHEATLELVSVDRIVIDAARPGVSRIELTVRVPDTASYRRAGEALEAADSSDLHVTDLHRIDVALAGPSAGRVIRLLPPGPWQTRPGAEYTARDAPDFTLSDLYTIRGLYRDTNQDLVPDRSDAYLSLHGADSPAGAAKLAARIGLETAGLRLPLARVAGEDDRPQALGFPILFGIGHYQTARLLDQGRLFGVPGNQEPGSDGDGSAAGAAPPAGRGAGSAGAAAQAPPALGFIQFVRRAFDDRHALVIGGTDAAGLDAAADYAARRMPYLWRHGKGNYRLADVETDVRRFFQARDAAGQAALAVHKLGAWLDRLAAEGGEVDSLHVELVTRDRPNGLAEFLESFLRERAPAAKASAAAHAAGFGVARPIFSEDFEIPWEVDAARAAFRSEALPALSPSSRGRIEVRVSEPPAVRAQLADEIGAELAAKGIPAGAVEVVVLSAYKQGYSWLHDEVLPKLRGRGVGRVEITYHTLRDSDEVRWQTIAAETRWLQELYPVDAVLARELGIPDSAMVFTPTRQPEPVYRVQAWDTAGAEILTDDFDPTYVVRPFFDLFPEYEQVRVTTGWIRVDADGRTLLDRRIRTDPEIFWEHFQTRTYARIVEYVMDVQDGRPSPANAPFFDELRVELALSEPDYRIGVDEEVISSLEALHEDIYFETLTLFDLIGNRYGAGRLDYAGRVLPYIRSTAEPGPGRARIAFTGKERGVAELVLTHRARGAEPVRRRYPLTPLPVEAPKLRGVTVRAGGEGPAALLFEVAAVDSLDRFDELKDRAAEPAIDRQVNSVDLLAGMTAALAGLHRAGILEDALAFDRVGELLFRFTVVDSMKYTRLFRLPRSARPRSTANPVLHDRSFRYDGRPIVQWRTPIPPAENDSVLAKLATFPTVNVYWMAKSFLGQDIYAADFVPPVQASHLSQAKLNALRPTLFISGRQHANEVSSTSHILRLAELLATDSSHIELLKKVNVVLHPITNPDGARLAYEMQLESPDFMLHAGYLGALGVDATAQANSPDPIYPEAKVRPELMETWLPDIYVNMHGYPSHEWVQYFAGYSAWVRSRTGTQRSWWAPRGWFIPGFSWVDDDEHPEIRTAQFAILDSIAAAITAEPDVVDMSRRMYARYRKYGRQDVENFREHFHNGILVYMALRGRKVTGSGPTNPRVNYFSVTTEAPDETARGDWLELVASAGLAHSTALLRYLAGGVNRIERESADYDGWVTRSVFRKKPVLPKEEEPAAAATDGGTASRPHSHTLSDRSSSLAPSSRFSGHTVEGAWRRRPATQDNRGMHLTGVARR